MDLLVTIVGHRDRVFERSAVTIHRDDLRGFGGRAGPVAPCPPRTKTTAFKYGRDRKSCREAGDGG